MATYRIKTGNGDEVVYTDETKSKEMKQRSNRNAMLADSDSMMLPDRELTDAKKAEWVTYRKALRDMDFSDLDNLNWPIKPE